MRGGRCPGVTVGGREGLDGVRRGKFGRSAHAFAWAPPPRILSGLVDRGILAKTSKATRGPSVTDVPGLKFPIGRTRPATVGEADQLLLDFDRRADDEREIDH